MGRSRSFQPTLSYTSIATAVSAALTGTNAHAQSVLEEIVVTATKRSESIRDVPLAITAFTSDDIAKRGFEGIDDYANSIPSLAFATREPGGTSVVFRGIAASGLQFGANPSAGVYLDEQPITSSGNNPDPRLIDIERLEALSGPQGTLFGDASQSGTLRIITNKADASQFEGWVDLGANTVADGEFGYDVSGMVNIPLVEDKVALRLVGFVNEEAGYIDNVLATSPGGTFDNSAVVGDDVNSGKYTGGRAALRFTPNDNWTIDLSAIFQSTDVDGFGDTTFGFEDERQQSRFIRETFEEDWYQGALTIEGSTSFGDVLFTAAYFDREQKYDADATSYQFAFQQIHDGAEAYYNALFGTVGYDYVGFYDFGGDPQGATAFNSPQVKRWSLEARLATPSDSDSRWSGLIGAFYSNSERFTVFESGNQSLPGSPAFYYAAYNLYNLSLNGLPPGSWAPTSNWFFGIYENVIDTKALFGEVKFLLSDNFSITAGGRFFDIDGDQGELLGGLQQGALGNAQIDFITNNSFGEGSDDGFVPKLNATYKLGDAGIIFATYAEGFRRGGANSIRPRSILPRQYESDTVKSIELGYKGAPRDNLYLEAVIYRMDWDNIQVEVNDPQPVVFQLGIANFPEAEITGFEAAFSWIPIDSWTLSGNIAYNDAEISRDALLFPQFPANPLPVAAGTRLPVTPEWKAYLGLEHTFSSELWGGTPYLRFDYAHVGEAVNALEGLEAIVGAPPPTIQDAYDTLDIKFGLETDLWDAGIYITNVTDDAGDQFINNRWAARRTSINRPRTIGLNFRRRF